MGPQLSLMGGPNWPSWEVDNFCHSCLLSEVGRKEPIFCLTVDKRKRSMLNESLPKNHLVQVAICDKSYIRDKPLIWDEKREFSKILSSISKIFGERRYHASTKSASLVNTIFWGWWRSENWLAGGEAPLDDRCQRTAPVTSRTFLHLHLSSSSFHLDGDP